MNLPSRLRPAELAALLALAVVTLLPPLFVLGYAASERWDRSLWPEQATLRWFEALGRDPRVAAASARTVVVAAACAAFTTLATAVATLMASLYAPRLRSALDLLAQLPYAVPPVVVAISALDLYVGRLGGLLDPRLLFVLLMVPLLMPLVHRAVSAALQRLDLHTLLEAGRTLGASDALTLRRVALPLLLPALAASALLTMMAAALEFAVANLLLGGENELLQPLMNSLRGASGHHAAALVVVSYAIVAMAAVAVEALTLRSTGHPGNHR